LIALPTGQKIAVRSEEGTIWVVSPLNLYLIFWLKFNGNQYLFQQRDLGWAILRRGKEQNTNWNRFSCEIELQKSTPLAS
jgi:hypothetical protein